MRAIKSGKQNKIRKKREKIKIWENFPAYNYNFSICVCGIAKYTQFEYYFVSIDDAQFLPFKKIKEEEGEIEIFF